MLLPIQSAWRFLLDPKPTQDADTASDIDTAKSTNFRAHFPELRTLIFDLTIRGLTSEPVFEEVCCTTPAKLEQLQEWIAQTVLRSKLIKSR
jgi:hypothetical protein